LSQELLVHTCVPQVNTCYVNAGGEMFKIRMLDYETGELANIIFEDLSGQLHQLPVRDWIQLNLIPVCVSWNTEPGHLCYEQESALDKNSYAK